MMRTATCLGASDMIIWRVSSAGMAEPVDAQDLKSPNKIIGKFKNIINTISY